MKTLVKCAVITLAGLSLAAGAFAAGELNQYSIGVKFGANWPATTNGLASGPWYPVLPAQFYSNSILPLADVAGVDSVAQANWNSVIGTNGITAAQFTPNIVGGPNGPTYTSVWDNNGAVVPSLSVSSYAPAVSGFANQWGEYNGTNFMIGVNGPDSPNYVLMSSFLEQSTGTVSADPGQVVTVTFSNVPPVLTTNGYDAYIYDLNSWRGFRPGWYTAQDMNSGNMLRTNLYVSATNLYPQMVTTWIGDPGTAQTNNASPFVMLQNGNYTVMRGLTSTNIQFAGRIANQLLNSDQGGQGYANSQPRAMFAAIQLVQAFVPGMPALASNIKVDTSMKQGRAAISWQTNAASGSAAATEGSLVIVRQFTPATYEPIAGTTYTYDPSFVYGNGQNVDNDNLGYSNYVVYAGAATNCTINGFISGQTYYVMVYTYSAGHNYRLSGVPSASFVPTATVTNIVTAPFMPAVVPSGASYLTVTGLLDSGGIADLRTSCVYSSSVPSTVASITNFAGRFGGVAVGGPVNLVVQYPIPQSYTNELAALPATFTNYSPNVLVRQSQTLRSYGGTAITPTNSAYTVNSFFDVYLDVSIDGGATWSPATNGPFHLVMINGSESYANNVGWPALPPLSGTYTSTPPTTIQSYANGVILSNLVLQAFTNNVPPPAAGGSALLNNNLTLVVSVSTNRETSASATPVFTSRTVVGVPMSAGITNISASDWLSATASVSVAAGYFDHRYSFNISTPDNGTTANDVGPAPLGAANGTEFSTVPQFDGSMGFGGQSLPGYVSFPTGLLTNYSAATFEAWFTDTGTTTWGRLFDFGNQQQTAATTTNGVDFVYYTPNAGGGNARQGIMVPGFNASAEQDTVMRRPLTNTLHHIVTTINGLTRTHTIYVDGLQLGINTNITQVPSDMGVTTNNFWGRSQYGGDPYVYGALYEFRTYTYPLSPLQVAVDNAVGPGSMVSESSIGTCTSLALYATNFYYPVFPWNNPLGDDDYEQVTLIATFSGISGNPPVDVTTLISNAVYTTGAVYTSSNTNVFRVDALGNVTPVKPGTATLTATFFGQTATMSITVVAVPTVLTHRWSFNETGSGNGFTVNDSIGGYAGTVVTTGNGNVVLSGGQATFLGESKNNGLGEGYIQLPNALFDGYNSWTVELWYTEFDTPTWSRLVAWGSDTTSYFFMVPAQNGATATTTMGTTNVDGTIASPAGNFRVAMTISGGGGENQLNTWRPRQFAEHHAVYALDAASSTAKLYIDGALQVVNPSATLRPRNLPSSTQNWLGRSFGNDGNYRGSMNELRLYKGALTADAVLIDYTLGPDTLPSTPTNTLGSFANTGSVVVPAVAAGSNVQAVVKANFANLANAIVTVSASNWISSSMDIARVDNFGVVSGVKSGSATISAQYGGATLTGTVTVGGAVNPSLLHRYSFDTDATDSVGGANGTLVGSAAVVNGALNLYGSTVTTNGQGAGTNGYVTGWSFVQLPGHLFDGRRDVTFEAWATGNYISNNNNSARLFDFGAPQGTNNGNGNSDAFQLHFLPAGAANGNMAVRFGYFNAAQTSLGANQVPNTNGVTSFNTNSAWGVTNIVPPADYVMPGLSNRVHYTVVISSTRQRADIYVNGWLWDTFQYGPSGYLYNLTNKFTPNISLPVQPEFLTNLIGYLGHAVQTNFFTGTPQDYVGTIDEFRIWSGSLDKLQAQVSEIYGPTNLLAGLNAGTPSAVRMILNDTNMILGSAQMPTVSADFTGTSPLLTNLDLTGLQTVVLTSSDSSKVVVTPDGRVQAVGTGGPVTITATYGGVSATANLTVVPKTLTLTHRYSWTTDARDSVGHADGTLYGQAYISNNAVILNGVPRPPTYVALPGYLVSGFDQITLEAWLITPGATAWTRVIDTGYKNNGSGREFFNLNAPGATTTTTTAQIGPSPQISQFGINVTGGSVQGKTNAFQHIACVIDGTQGTNSTFAIYLNGVLQQVNSNVYYATISQIHDPVDQFGRSMSSGDAFFNGQMTECRIYYGAMTTNQMAASYVSGPNGVGGLSIANAGGGNVTLSWPGSGAANDPAALATLVYSTTIIPSPVTWTPVGIAPTYNPANNQYSVTVAVGATPKYFKLVNNTP